MKFILVFLLSLSLVSAAEVYYADESIEDDEFTVTQLIDEDDYVYSVAPGDFKHIEATLKGDLDFLPRLTIYDPITQEVLERLIGVEGQTLIYRSTSGLYQGDAREYYLVVDTFNSDGQTFTFSYEAELQNDALSGGDASHAFRDGILLEPGVYDGFLGDEDEVDHYSMQLYENEELEMIVIPDDSDNMRLFLIDDSFTTKVNQRSILEDVSLDGAYVSPRDQIVFIGIEGSVEYQLVLNVTNRKEIIDEPLVKEVEIEEPEVEPVEEVDTDQEEVFADEGADTVDEPESESNAGFIVTIILLLIVAGVAVYFAMKTPKKK